MKTTDRLGFDQLPASSRRSKFGRQNLVHIGLGDPDLLDPERDSIACRNYAVGDEMPQADESTASLHTGPGASFGCQDGIIALSSLPQTSNNISQKGLAFVGERSGSVTVPGTRRAPGS